MHKINCKRGNKTRANSTPCKVVKGQLGYLHPLQLMQFSEALKTTFDCIFYAPLQPKPFARACTYDRSVDIELDQLALLTVKSRRMKKLSFRALKSQDKTWDALIEDWRTQCSEFDEDIDQFAMTSLPVLGRLAAEPEANAAVFALLDDQEAHHAVVQLNRAMLPKTSGWTLRARHMILSPKYDYGAYSIDDYAIAIGSTVAETLTSQRTIFQLTM